MIHHFLHRGFKPEYIINLSLADKIFFRASLDLFIEEENQKYSAISGG